MRTLDRETVICLALSLGCDPWGMCCSLGPGSGTQLAHAVPSLCSPPCCGCGMLKQNTAPFSLDLCSPPASALSRLEMQTPLPRGGWGHHSIPAAPHPPSARRFSQLSAVFTLCFPHPQPLSPVSLPAAVPGRRDVKAVGLNTAGKPGWERGCPAALLPLPRWWGILGSVVPAGAAVIQRLSLGLLEAHGTCTALHRPARFHGLLLLLCLTSCSLGSSVISLCSIFSCWVDLPGCVLMAADVPPYLCRTDHLHKPFPNPLWTH